jgi:pectate lyase
MKLYDYVRKYGWEAMVIAQSLPNARPEGNIWLVDSGATNAADTADESIHGCSWDEPFATLNYAISRCTASQGDIILLAPGHAESLSTTATASGTTTTEVGVDIAGVHILGLGTASLRPTFTCTATAGQIAVLAANVTIENIIMVSDIADLTDMITLDASSDGCTIKNCEFRDGAANKEVVAMIDIATTVDDVTIEGCRFFSTDTNDAGLAAIRFAGTGARAVIRNCYMRGDFNTSAILASAGKLTDVLIENNYINNIDAAADNAAILMKSDGTGMIVRNLVHAGKDATAGIAAAAMACCENYCTTIEAESGNLCPAAGDWAT